MNSYFPNPFLSPLQGDNPAIHSNLQCNFTSLPGRYDQQSGQSYLAPGQGMASQFGSAGSNHSTINSVSDPSSCPRPAELNGYENQGHLASSGSWALPSSQSSSTDYSQSTPAGSDNNYNSCSVTHSSYNVNNSSQHIPFYPWMGIVGVYIFLHHLL